MSQGHLGPNATFKQSIVVAVELLADRNPLRVEVFQRCPVTLLFLDIAHVNLVDEPVFALSGNLGLSGIGFIRANVILLQGRQHCLHTGIHLRLIITGAILSEQKLQDERRDVGAFLDPMQQILAQHFPVESRV
ncbi:hypothetical protein D3C85_1144500 [compost metagenome]